MSRVDFLPNGIREIDIIPVDYKRSRIIQLCYYQLIISLYYH